MKNTKRYLSIFLALALAAPVFTGCDNGLDEYKSGETIAPPSDKFKAEIQFVSRLTDGALAGSDADYAAIDNYMVNTLEGRGKSWLTVLDRADGANQPKTMQTALNTKRWTAFAFNRIANKSSYQGSMLYFNGPTTEVKGTPSGSGCYVTGFAPTLNGTRTDKDEDGNVTGTTNVSFAISFNTARFENADQINAFDRHREKRPARRAAVRSREYERGDSGPRNRERPGLYDLHAGRLALLGLCRRRFDLARQRHRSLRHPCDVVVPHRLPAAAAHRKCAAVFAINPGIIHTFAEETRNA